MSETDLLESARRRLALALDALEAVTERRQKADRSEEALASQIYVLDTDRAQLASELDQATARSRTLEAVNREVVKRIEQAIDTVCGVLAAKD
jgi:chromosome segregation ATPase